MRLDAPVFVRLAPFRGVCGDLTLSLVALSAPELGEVRRKEPTPGVCQKPGPGHLAEEALVF